jgi:hypothetical protein
MFRIPSISRRDLLRLSAAGVLGGSMSGWLKALADDTAKNPQRKRACILLWMNGGPSQMDTFDLKPGHANGGEFKEISTNAPGLKFSEHLPKLAKHGDQLAVIRSMQTKEGDHGRAAFHLRTGYLPQGPIQYPALGALLSKELGNEDSALPNFVSIGPERQLSPGAYTSGFLGPQYAPLIIGGNRIFAANPNGGDVAQALKVQDLDLPSDVNRDQADARVSLLQTLENDFVSSRPGVSTHSHQSAYERALRLMRSDAAKAFNLEDEKAALRDSYGRNQFGQACLLARRLVERGVPFIEITLDGWDTHNNNFDQVKRLSQTLDPAWATLLEDLKDHGLLDTTLVIWMGEFGRTPKIAKERTGRDHFQMAWSTVLSGGGIKGGQAVGKTSASGEKVEERPVPVNDFMATVCSALGIKHDKTNPSNVGRPIKIADTGAKPIEEVIA